jgi:Mannosyl-glycoprotein endo-beta-N-acetylglucosaminidase
MGVDFRITERQTTALPVPTFQRSLIAAFAVVLLSSSALSAAPAIRTSDSNRVPQCVTPERLTTYLKDRNPSLDPRYRDIAKWYKHFGEAWRVRWDYAFYQMILETNALKYRREDGRRGDVHEKQNNFAGIGATGRGAPGDKYPDIKTGVHAQIQHLVAYSGEMLAAPIAPRTQLVQDSIVEQSRKLKRPVTFGDLARRWAVDRAYARSIDGVAEQFRNVYCSGVNADASPSAKEVPAPQPVVRRPLASFAPPSGLGGPKPQMLAGPDTLPWAANEPTAGPPPNPASKSESSAATSPTKKPTKAPPVRTIWTREKGAIDGPTKSATAPSPKQSAAPVAVAPAPSPAPTMPVSTASPVEGPDADGSTTLPTFKIEPMPAPSRLGGPAILSQASDSSRF